MTDEELEKFRDKLSDIMTDMVVKMAHVLAVTAKDKAHLDSGINIAREGLVSVAEEMWEQELERRQNRANLNS